MKDAQEIVNYLVGINGYPHLLSLLTRMPREDQGKFIIACMKCYAEKQAKIAKQKSVSTEQAVKDYCKKFGYKSSGFAAIAFESGVTHAITVINNRIAELKQQSDDRAFDNPLPPEYYNVRIGELRNILTLLQS